MAHENPKSLIATIFIAINMIAQTVREIGFFRRYDSARWLVSAVPPALPPLPRPPARRRAPLSFMNKNFWYTSSHSEAKFIAIRDSEILPEMRA